MEYKYDMETLVKTTSLSKNDFSKLSRFIYQHCGIKMPEAKKIMVEARLRKRLRELNINSYSNYCNYLFSEEGMENEIVHMVDVITTNKTDFFREPAQFSFMLNNALPELVSSYSYGTQHPLGVWSAGCSTGEEPYTISMVLNEFAQKLPGFSFNIFATDISTRVLEKAVAGIYESKSVEQISKNLLKKYFLRSKDPEKQLVRVNHSVRKSVHFQRLNFMESNYGINISFDIIFCRNVIIYFDKETQERLITKLIKYLEPGGYLFLGHSETIFSTNLPLIQLAPSTFQKVK